MFILSTKYIKDEQNNTKAIILDQYCVKFGLYIQSNFDEYARLPS